MNAAAPNNDNRNKAQKKYSYAQYDRMNSTFRHIIRLDPSKKYIDKQGIERYNNATEFIMYSKKQGYNEPIDKERMLQGEIIRIHTNGYFEKTLSIILTVNEPFSGAHVTIAILYPNTYELHDSKYSNAELGRFLEELYNKRRNPESAQVFVKKASRKTIEIDPFDGNKRFVTSERCIDYCTMLIQQGHARGAVQAFWFKMQEKHNHWKK